ncbi:MAG: hypothetical protein GY696_02025 [Gammaproteobacteria bacterium]|nr:hypothetical protein [Gammaproteobacteria bacterium]
MLGKGGNLGGRRMIIKTKTSMFIRWTKELAALDFEVKHRPGQLNTNADALSRREDKFMPPPTDQEEKEQTECINLVKPDEELPVAVDVDRDGPRRDLCLGPIWI